MEAHRRVRARVAGVLRQEQPYAPARDLGEGRKARFEAVFPLLGEAQPFVRICRPLPPRRLQGGWGSPLRPWAPAASPAFPVDCGYARTRVRSRPATRTVGGAFRAAPSPHRQQAYGTAARTNAGRPRTVRKTATPSLVAPVGAAAVPRAVPVGEVTQGYARHRTGRPAGGGAEADPTSGADRPTTRVKDGAEQTPTAPVSRNGVGTGTGSAPERGRRDPRGHAVTPRTRPVPPAGPVGGRITGPIGGTPRVSRGSAPAGRRSGRSGARSCRRPSPAR
jgi:hypothetical protein